MSFFEEEYDEIDLNDNFLEDSEFSSPRKPQSKIEKQKKIPLLNKTTANPNTFEYETLLKQVNIHQKHLLDSNFIKTPSPRSDTRSTVERLIFNHQLSENRKQFLRQEKEVNELKSCTFSPQLNNSKRTLQKSNSERRTIITANPSDTEIQTHQKKTSKTRDSPFFHKNPKVQSPVSGKSHSLEHSSEVSEIITPRKGKVTVGRPPIPKSTQVR